MMGLLHMSRDTFCCVLWHLDVRTALDLRRVCKRVNVLVTTANSYWLVRYAEYCAGNSTLWKQIDAQKLFQLAGLGAHKALTCTRRCQIPRLRDLLDMDGVAYPRVSDETLHAMYARLYIEDHCVNPRHRTFQYVPGLESTRLLQEVTRALGLSGYVMYHYLFTVYRMVRKRRLWDRCGDPDLRVDMQHQLRYAIAEYERKVAHAEHQLKLAKRDLRLVERATRLRELAPMFRGKNPGSYHKRPVVRKLLQDIN